MPVQSHGDGWRARKKHAGQWFRGPVRDSVQVAEEDAKKFDEASAVSLEALQEMQRNLTSVNAARNVEVEKHSSGWRLRWGTGDQRRCGPFRKQKAEAEEDARRVSVACGVSTQEAERIFEELSQNPADATAVVEKHSNGWRLRWGTGDKRRCGPTRKEKAEAEEDARRVSTACGVSTQEAEKIFEQLSQNPNLALEKRSTGWRLRYGTGQNRRYGPTRPEKATAEEDLRRVSDASGVSLQEVEKVFSQLNTDGRSEADDFPLQYLQVCLGKLNPAALPRRQRDKYRSQEIKPENAGVVHACKLLVSEYQLAENLASRVDARWLHDMGLHWRLDSGSRPVGTSGFDHVAPISGLRNLGNSCWLNALLQCFLACGPLAKDFLDQTCEKGPLRHWLTATLVKLRSRDFDSVAPFELLQQLFLTRAAIFSPGESADTADALHLLLETCLSDISLVAPVRALTGQEMCRYSKLIR